jgi:hypothetical protein
MHKATVLIIVLVLALPGQAIAFNTCKLSSSSNGTERIAPDFTAIYNGF